MLKQAPVFNGKNNASIEKPSNYLNTLILRWSLKMAVSLRVSLSNIKHLRERSTSLSTADYREATRPAAQRTFHDWPYVFKVNIQHRRRKFGAHMT